MVNPVWMQTFGAVITGLASITIAVYTWRLWKLETLRRISDIRASWARVVDDLVIIRIYNAGHQADSVTSVTLDKLCPDFDEKKEWEIYEWELYPPGREEPVGVIRPGSMVDLTVGVPNDYEFEGPCAHHIQIELAIDDAFAHTIGENRVISQNEHPTLGTEQSIDD